LGDYLLLSRGEAAHGGRANISLLADTFESLVGAIYVDSNIATVFEFLNKHLLPTLATISQLKVIKDPKSYFQEICQSATGVTPHYTIVSQTGPDHARTFEASVMVGDRSIAVGTGNSKQKAEEAAAIAATKVFETSKPIN
jgi:ribonuclease-3